jgi:hypothetical protein
VEDTTYIYEGYYMLNQQSVSNKKSFQLGGWTQAHTQARLQAGLDEDLLRTVLNSVVLVGYLANILQAKSSRKATIFQL